MITKRVQYTSSFVGLIGNEYFDSKELLLSELKNILKIREKHLKEATESINKLKLEIKELEAMKND